MDPVGESQEVAGGLGPGGAAARAVEGGKSILLADARSDVAGSCLLRADAHGENHRREKQQVEDTVSAHRVRPRNLYAIMNSVNRQMRSVNAAIVKM